MRCCHKFSRPATR